MGEVSFCFCLGTEVLVATATHGHASSKAHGKATRGSGRGWGIHCSSLHACGYNGKAPPKLTNWIRVATKSAIFVFVFFVFLP